METPYRSEVCDLCHSKKYSVLIKLKTGRALRSDRKIVNCNLEKCVCDNCGLVRGSRCFDKQALEDYYSDEYRLSERTEEYFFHTPRGEISRSSLFCDWMLSASGAAIWEKARHCLEVGAGSGLLLREMGRRFPKASCEGIELNRDAVHLARQRGIIMHQGEPADLAGEQYDVVYSIAVLEHVPSPTKFLKELRRLLKPGGHLFLCQPTQDVPSYDLFFIDHLHHFGTEHLRQYARKTGFHERGVWVGHPWMPNFSLHLWQAVELGAEFVWEGRPGHTKCAAASCSIVADMKNLNALIASLTKRQRRVALFGLNEVYWLACAYSDLADFRVVCGLDDNPDKSEYAALEFPVLKPEDCLALRVQDVVLTMNKVYYEYARRRLEKLGLETHPVLS
jgi:2-polyprenyl-3-methyl-5-hydroxy-6-metoxy-1,4-benzoquinol methylase